MRPLAPSREAGREALPAHPGHGQRARGAEDADGRAADGVGGYQLGGLSEMSQREGWVGAGWEVFFFFVEEKGGGM